MSSTYSIHNSVKIFTKIILCLFIFSIISCSDENMINKIYDDWMQVENSLENDSSTLPQEFYQFLNNYKEFKTEDIYKNLVISETYRTSLQNLDEAVTAEDISKIRIAIFSLSQIDIVTTLKSNHEYIYLSQILFIFTLVISVILFIFFKKYEKKRNEAKQMGIYSKFIIEGIETERSRISKEIHDSVLQDIKALFFKCELIDLSDAEKNENLKKDLVSQTNSCITQLRSICNNLTPIELTGHNKDSNGFINAVRNLTTQFNSKTGISCILKLQENLDISSLKMQQTINVFRIIQEALNNVEKHAKADKVSIVISVISKNNQKFLKVYITDDGIGFDSENKLRETAYRHGHFGLSNMKNRAKDLNAVLNISAEENSGTEIILEVPIK